jgi:hypothetical protein
LNPFQEDENLLLLSLAGISPFDQLNQNPDNRIENVPLLDPSRGSQKLNDLILRLLVLDDLEKLSQDLKRGHVD